MEQSKAEKPVIHQDLVVLDMNCSTAEEAIRQLAGKLEERRWVKEGYTQAVLNREKEYPTGLPTNEAAVAIPHTNAEYCLKSAMVTGILREPVSFGNMANPDEMLPVRIIFLLAMKEPALQVQWLKQLVSMLRKPGMLENLVNQTSRDEVVNLLKTIL
ncbi:MAG: PTS sugar transporter subunit IIA [Anaerolineae bacterium]|nr:PTS sugar transporter subunit IIA [Anaerolineae bacterium]